MKAVLYLQPVVDPDPGAFVIGIHLAHCVGHPAAGAVQEPLWALRMGAYATGIGEHALSAERTPLEELSDPLYLSEISGV